MDIRFWIGGETRCTVAKWNCDVSHEPWSKLYLPLNGSPRYAVARPGEPPRWTDLRPGGLYLIPGGRRQINACKADFTLVWCHFTVQDSSLLARIAAMDAISVLPADLLSDIRGRITGCCQDGARTIAASALVHEALSRLPDPPADALAGTRRRLATAVFHLEYRFDRHPSIRELAERAGLAPSRFHELFRAAYGTSVHDYRLALRLAEAKRLLTSSDQSIQEIATHCGYPNPFNFTRMFTRRCGLSPTVWRDQAAEG